MIRGTLKEINRRPEKMLRLTVMPAIISGYFSAPKFWFCNILLAVMHGIYLSKNIC